MGRGNLCNQKNTMFALVDCNNFYASCERLFRPELNGKPVVVLSNNDGCVIARSNEAKAIGIPMGAPAYQYDALFRTHSVSVFSANFPLYGDLSNRVMQILSEYSPEIEIYSIDELFLKLVGFEFFDLQSYGASMREKVFTWTGIPISVGIAPSKALSKLANRIAKKYPEKTAGVYIIDSEEKIIKALKWLKIEDVWGIGSQLSKKLKAINVFSAYDFTLTNDAWIKKNMGIVGIRLKRDLQGLPTLDLESLGAKKNIATTRTFDRNTNDLNYLEERVSTFAVACAEKLRKQKSCCNSLLVFIHTNGHRQDLAQYHQHILVQLPFPTNSSIELSQFATAALKKIFHAEYQYKKAGVIVQDITPEYQKQLSVFNNSNELHAPLMKAFDKINNIFGQQKIRLGSQDRRIWKMKQERLSPRYTTKLSDIIIVKV